MPSRLQQTLLGEAADSNAPIEVTVRAAGRYFIAAVDTGGGGIFSLRLAEVSAGEGSQDGH